MVSVPGLTLIALLLGCGAPGAQSVSLHYWAVEATVEGREIPSFDAGAAPIKSLLEDLSYDTFRTVLEKGDHVEQDRDKSVTLNRLYAVNLRFAGTDDTDRARLVVTVTLAPREPGGLPRKVVETTLLLAPGGKARVCGLRCEKGGEIIIVLSRS